MDIIDDHGYPLISIGATPVELLRDMRAQHAARHTYRANADRLWDMAYGLRRDGWQGWAHQVERFAMIAEKAAQAER